MEDDRELTVETGADPLSGLRDDFMMGGRRFFSAQEYNEEHKIGTYFFTELHSKVSLHV